MYTRKVLAKSRKTRPLALVAYKTACERIFQVWFLVSAGGTYWYLFGKPSPFSLESVRPPGPLELDREKGSKILKQGECMRILYLFRLQEREISLENLDAIVIGSGMTAAATLAKESAGVPPKQSSSVINFCCCTTTSVERVTVKKDQEDVEVQAPVIISNCGVFNTFQKLLPAHIQTKPEIQKRVNMMRPGRGCLLVFSGFDATQEELGINSTNTWLFNSNDMDAMLVLKQKNKLVFQEVCTPLSNAYYLGSHLGSMCSAEQNLERFQAEAIARNCCDTPVKNLFLSGQDVFSSGIAGALHGGLLCASTVLKHIVYIDLLMLKKKLKRKKASGADEQVKKRL
ncbi:hypothetical protein QTP70_021924 [Hemibagrus guttatus]|uniref:Uncharacterized protein n=1 Tax=Hemibagrus guttatus TaxID=175788 RepID=A0AAE0QPP3_9TELE|nr:hypothetical protein QTP70_021924 [Hemibagrus guttatus]